jgi:hypothetical protein
VEAVVLVALAIAMLWLIDRAGVFLSSGAVRVLVSGFVAWLGGKFDPWPSGVQEEDRDQPWGRGSQASVAPTMALSKVHPSLGRH